MKKNLVLFLVLLFCVTGFSQTENSDDAFHQLIDKSLELIDNRKLDSAEVLLKNSSKILLTISKDSTLIYKQALADAALSMRKGNNKKALEVFLTVLPYFNKTNDTEHIALTYYQLGICHYFLNMRSVSKEYFEKANSLSKHLSPRIQTKILQNLGTIHLEEGMSQQNNALLEKAISNFEQASDIYKKERQIPELALCQSLLGEAYIQLGEYSMALEIINGAIDYANQANSQDYLAFALIKKSSILGKRKQYSEAITTVNRAIEIYRSTQDLNSRLYAFQEKKKFLEARKEYQEAVKVGDSIWSLTINIYNNRIADGVAEMETKYKTAEKEREIAEQRLEIQNKNIFTIILVGSIIILAILIIGLYKRHQFKQSQFKKEIELKDALANIKTQNKLQEQRLEISRDLHDNIGAQLTFIISSIDNLKHISRGTSEKLEAKLSSISGFTSETIGQLRDTIWAMNKSAISFEELQGRLLSYIQKVNEMTAITPIKIKGELNSEIHFNSVTGMNLFRVIQEALNNAIKHASANEIVIEFSQIHQNISISIKDDGKGFDPLNFEAGNGLSNMEHRIASIQGSINIKSEPNKGTEILIKLSL